MCEVKHGQTDCGCRAVKNSKYLTYDYEVGLNFFQFVLGRKEIHHPNHEYVENTLTEMSNGIM